MKGQATIQEIQQKSQPNDGGPNKWWFRGEQKTLFDCFEPSLMFAALTLTTCHPKVDVSGNRAVAIKHRCILPYLPDPKPCNRANKQSSLGALTFGETKWKQLTGEDPKFDDPLSKWFRKGGKFTSIPHAPFPNDWSGIPIGDRAQTYLDLSLYTSLENLNVNKETMFRPTFYYKVSDDAVYTIVEDFPLNSAPIRVAK